MGVNATIYYRLSELEDNSINRWVVSWKCGSRWLLVFGPASEHDARNWMQVQLKAMDQITPEQEPKKFV